MQGVDLWRGAYGHYDVQTAQGVNMCLQVENGGKSGLNY